MTYKDGLEEYVDEFADKMKDRFIEKRITKYGDEWKRRPVSDTAEYQHQNRRFLRWFEGHMEEWKEEGVPVDWLDVACEAMICYVREREEHAEKVLS